MPALDLSIPARALRSLGHQYPDAASHLDDELVYARRLLARWWEAARAVPAVRTGALDDLDLERFVAETPAGSDRARQAASERGRGEVARLRTQIDARVAATTTSLPVVELIQRFELTAIERDVLTVLLAMDLDRGFERAYLVMCGDGVRKRLDVGGVVEIAATDAAGRRAATLALVAGATLERRKLVELEPIRDRIDRGVMTRGVRIAPRIAAHVLGSPIVDESLLGVAVACSLGACADDLVLEEGIRDQLLARVTRALGSSCPRLVLRGPAGAGKKMIAATALATVSGVTAWLHASVAGLVATGEQGWRALWREVVLRDAGLYLDAGALDGIAATDLAALGSVLADLPNPIVIGCTADPAALQHAFPTTRIVEVPIPDAHERHLLWRARLAGQAHDDSELREIARRFPLTGGAIDVAATAAVDRAIDRSLVRDPDDAPHVHIGDLIEGARRHLAPRLEGVATRITSAARWSDIVLPDDILERVRDIVRFAAQRPRVFDSWNFASKFPYGRGLSALFWGPPGTGKTMIASAIAGELGMELFRVDLSKLVSKWIGETEKNLSRVFDEAQAGQTVLLFDEADSLFAPRTDVKSSNDRYANLEVNFLLQKMEDFEGITILTTNFAGGIDEAFQRRLRFRVEFPFPEPEERTELWHRMIPAEAAIASNVDWRALGDEFELAGGNIKNAVLHAAFTAAHRGDHITCTDLRLAALLECREMGRIIAG